MCFCSKICYCVTKLVAFASGFGLGQMYYCYLLKQIPFPYELGSLISVVLSAILGIGTASSKQLRCVCVLMLPMYSGKPGRAVLKAVILTYIVTGPITNMGLNAREVVRVFACSARLSSEVAIEKHHRLDTSAREAPSVGDLEQVKEQLRTMRSIIELLRNEIIDEREIQRMRLENDFVDDLFTHKHRSKDIEIKFQNMTKDNSSRIDIQSFYEKKFQYRCEHQLSRAQAVCVQEFTKAYQLCTGLVNPEEVEICQPLKESVCDLIAEVRKYLGEHLCTPPINRGLNYGYESLEQIKEEFVVKLDTVHLQYKNVTAEEMKDFQDYNRIADLIEQAFEEKATMMRHVLTAMNVCMALLFLRIFKRAATYHDMYLTSIDHDNGYITGYFKRLDARRSAEGKTTLLPLKKMETNKYIDVHSLSYKESQRSNLGMQILKVMLEVVTATTFVMLDRMFYEALEVVRLHAEVDPQKGARDYDMEVEGTGILASMLRRFLNDLNSSKRPTELSNAVCIPRPRQMPYIYFVKIYGGYLWIVILLLLNPYTLRLRRLICSYFYPLREKERVLHLYNDLLKKRAKMHKTLRRRAVRAVRAHYLSGETLLSARMRFPRLLGWLRVLPAARMACLICGETEPRDTQLWSARWHSCVTAACPFVQCASCWREAGARCVACEPAAADVSDDTLTDTTPRHY